MTEETQVILATEVQLSLFDLAEIANREHEAAQSALVSTLEHGFNAGAALIEVKGRLNHGEWLPWLKENFNGSHDTASVYMRIARNFERARNLEEPSLRAALKAITGKESNDEANGSTDDLSVHYSSATDDWATPQGLFDQLDEEFNFTLDVCASAENAKCEDYFDRETDGLSQEWTGVCWMNPPYGDVIGAWVAKAHKSTEENGAMVVCLVPARTDTAWWWDHARYGEVRFLRGRLKFGDSENSAPFPSAVVIFGRPACVKWWER